MASERDENNRAMVQAIDAALQQNPHDVLLLVKQQIEAIGAEIGLTASQSVRILEHLLDEGYFREADRNTGYGQLHAVAIKGITEKGYAFLEHRHAGTSMASGQTITISGGSFGNVILGAQGSATIANSPVNQGVGDLKQLLGQLSEAIDGSGAPNDAKADAKLEAGQLQLELEKGRKNPERIAGYLKSIPELVRHSTAVVELADKIGQFARAAGWM